MKSKKNEEKYLEFAEKLRQYVEEVTADWQVKISLTWSGEKEGQKEDLLVVVMESEKEGVHIQRFHIEDIYDDYVEGDSLEDIYQEVKAMLERCREIEKASPLSRMESYESVKDQLIIRPINSERNRERLQEGVYETVGDIALVLYVNIGNFQGIYTSSMVPRKLLQIWKKDEKEVLEAAKKNTYDLFPPKLLTGFELDWASGANFKDFMDPTKQVEMKSNGFGSFITTENKCNGAVAIFLPGVAKRLADLVGNDLYIAFTSMHEAVVHDCRRLTVEGIQSSLSYMNEYSPAGDFLTNQVYYYSREEDRITVVSGAATEKCNDR